MARKPKAEPNEPQTNPAPIDVGDAAKPIRRRRRTRKTEPLTESAAEPVAVVEATPVRPGRIRVSVPDDSPPIPGLDEPAKPDKPTRSRRGRKPTAEPEPETAPKRGRRGRTPKEPAAEGERPTRGRRTRAPVVEDKVETVPLPEVAVRKPRRPREQPRWPKPILPPIGAPRVGVANGQPVLVIKEQVVAPHFFFGNINSEASERSVLAEIKKAAENGLHLHILFLELPVDSRAEEPASEEALRLVESVLQADPDGYVLFRTVFSPVPGWSVAYPSAIYRFPDGVIAEPSICSEDWWGEAAKCLKKLVTDVAKRTDRVIGYHLERGEWFNGKESGYDTSPAAQEAFRKWVKTRYFGDVVALRASWFDGDVDFGKLRIPDYEHLHNSTSTLLTDRKERQWVDYHDFLSDAIVERIGALARVVKETSKGACLVACSYGYTYEFSHPHSGHLSLARLLNCPDIDIIAGPPSYKSRLPGGACPFPSPIDSIALAGKLFLSEEDFKTSLGKKDEPDEFNPALETPQALESAHWRGIGMALAHGSGVVWMDTWGNGWLNAPSVWQRAGKARELWTQRISTTPSPPDVAVLIDERSMTMLSDPRLYETVVERMRESVLRAGISAGFYLLSDLTRSKFPDCKLYLFMNAWDIGPQVRTAIKDKLHKDGKTLAWWYGAALMEYHRPALDRIREVTGIALKTQPYASKPGTTITHKNQPLTESLSDSELSGSGTWEPTFFVIEEDVDVLGAYTDTGLPSFVLREVKAPGSELAAWRTVFLGEPYVTPSLIRGLCNVAGVRVWDSNDDVSHVRPPFVTVHSARGGRRTLDIPTGQEMRDALEGQPAETAFSAQDGGTKLFLVGTSAELAVLQTAQMPAPPEIRMPEIEKPQPIPETRIPLFTFDVEPEVFNRQDVLVEEPPAPKKRRGGRRTRPATRTESAPPPEPQAQDEVSVGFRFRKKA